MHDLFCLAHASPVLLMASLNLTNITRTMLNRRSSKSIKWSMESWITQDDLLVIGCSAHCLSFVCLTTWILKDFIGRTPLKWLSTSNLTSRLFCNSIGGRRSTLLSITNSDLCCKFNTTLLHHRTQPVYFTHIIMGLVV